MTSRSVGLRNEAVREANGSLILRAVHMAGVVSRTDLVSSVGLTRSSIGALVGDLVGYGMVTEERARPDGSPGRPSSVVSAASSQNVVIALEILVDSIAVSAVGIGGVDLFSERADRERGRISAEQTTDDLVDLYRKVLAQLDPSCAVYGIGAAVPAQIRAHDNQVILAPNLGWHDLALADMLRQKMQVDLPISLENEAAAAALAESRRGAAVGFESVLCVWGEVGIGGGIVSGGRLHQGASGFAGEIGHLPINLQGERCGCGAIGCLETEVGEESLLRRAGRPTDGGRTGLGALFTDAHAGDSVALEALAEHGRWLGIGLGGLINLLDPNVVVLGGFLGEAMPFLRATMEPELEHRALASIRESLQVVPGECGPNAPLLGAAERAWDDIIAHPSQSHAQRVLVADLT